MSGDTKFSVLCAMFNWMQKTKSSPKKRSKFRKFIDHFCKSEDYFSAIRLILPNLDRERGTYGLKESVLAICLIDALGMSRESEDAIRLINWRKGGPKTGVNVGNFALVAAEVLQRRQGMTSGGLSINELNQLLDTLSLSESRAEKMSVLANLIAKTNAQEMKWIIMIILKDLKLGISEKSIFHEFHPDAEDLFNVTCDLKLVCEKLKDRNQRHKRQDIELGRPVRPQLAARIGNAAAAWKKLHGKEVVVECKFDGDRIQIHKNGTAIHFFSRNFLDHPEYEHAMSDIVLQNILVDRCILDGEMLVWDTSLNRFADFGSNQEIAKAAKEGLDSDRQLCYVAFDVLYVGDSSVIHQTLKERHELLRKFVKPLKGRLEILVPDAGLNARCTSGEPCWSFVAHSVEEVERFFKETIENRDEGIILKDLNSNWEPSDRSGKWLKLKPDYVNAGSDLDVLIIGGYYGSGKRGGEVAQFLVGLAEPPSLDVYPHRFISFCRVGTGLSDEELDSLVSKLKPYFRKNEYPRKPPPSFYLVTNNSKERPDVWIDSPEKSIILSITSDIRTVKSEVFAAPYGLRFPRIDRVRYDKPWHECLNVQNFVELVNASNGTTQGGKDFGNLQSYDSRRRKHSRKGEKSNMSVVPCHLLHTDVSSIKGETKIFSGVMFYFVNAPSSHSIDSFHKLVVENGGRFSMNLNNSVTYSVAAESRGIKYQAAKLHGDVIHYSWVLECCAQKKLLQLQPKHFLFLSDSSKKKLQENIDEYSDSYYMDLDIPEAKQLLSNIVRSEDPNIVDHYIQKYSPEERWFRFRNYSLYFHLVTESLDLDLEVVLKLAVRRMTLDILMSGGKVSKSLSLATHLVVLPVPGADIDFNIILRSLSVSDRYLVQHRRLPVVSFQWLEDCLLKNQKLPEDAYTIIPHGLDLINEKGEQGTCSEEPSGWDGTMTTDQSSSTIRDEQGTGNPQLDISRFDDLPKKDNKRKKDEGDNLSSKKTRGISQARHKQPRYRKGPVKISEIKQTLENMKDPIDRSYELVERQNLEVNENEMGQECGSTKVIPKAQFMRRPQGVGKRTAKISETESGHNSHPDGRMNEESGGDGNHHFHKILERRSSVEDPLLSEKSAKSDRNAETYGRQDDRVFEATGCGVKGWDEGGVSQKHEKVEIMLDPFQALLFDMVPSLGSMHKDAATPHLSSTENTHQEPEPADMARRESEATDTTRRESEATDTTRQEPEPADTTGREPELVKKKKVSYRDVAGELLKDW